MNIKNITIYWEEIFMLKSLYKKGLVLGVISLFVGVNVYLSTGMGLIEKLESSDDVTIGIYDDDLEYWALIVGVGIYAKHPEQNISSHLDAEGMYHSLISSEHWKEDHIKLITCENATKINITKGFRWLDEMEDKDDVSVIYISTHGGQLSLFGMPIDLPPFDETDHCDEVLATYYSFANPLTYLRDDELKFLVNKLESQGICVIIDSCYAGGFNDTSCRITLRSNIVSPTYINEDFSSTDFINDFSEEIRKDGRVILMSSLEDEVSWGDSKGGHFTNILKKSIGEGFGDLNNNGFISAEEAFNYTQPRTGYNQHPTMYDGYEGELHLTVAWYETTFFDNCENVGGWTTIDHTEGIGGDLWHLSENNYVSPKHCWYLGDENTMRYNNYMNNSLVSPEIKLGEKPWLIFMSNLSKDYYDDLRIDISTDNWSTYSTRYGHYFSIWRANDISLYSSSFGNFSGETIQMRFRITSDESIPFDLRKGVGFFMIDDIFIYSERRGFES